MPKHSHPPQSPREEKSNHQLVRYEPNRPTAHDPPLNRKGIDKWLFSQRPPALKYSQAELQPLIKLSLRANLERDTKLVVGPYELTAFELRGVYLAMISELTFNTVIDTVGKLREEYNNKYTSLKSDWDNYEELQPLIKDMKMTGLFQLYKRDLYDRLDDVWTVCGTTEQVERRLDRNKMSISRAWN